MKELLIGSHVSLNSPDFFVGSVKEALSYNSSTFMFYTGAPQNTFRKPLYELKIEEGKKLLKQHNIDETKLIVHAPYIINAANLKNLELYEMSINTIVSELRRTAAFGSKIMVLHPGSHVGLGLENGIIALAKALDTALKCDGTDVKIAIETMAGKGHEIGTTFEQIADIINRCEKKERLGICLDTCHINDAGYDVRDIDGILKHFDDVIGLERLLVVHVNDTKNPIGAHKDRHENIGYGYLGFETLYKVVHHPLLEGIPMILETPFYNENAPYKYEIEMLRSGKYVEGWRESIFGPPQGKPSK